MKLDIQDDSGLASSMLFTKAEDMEDAEYDIGQPMDEGSLSDFTLTKDQIEDHKWNHVEINEEYNFDLTQNDGEHIDLLDGTFIGVVSIDVNYVQSIHIIITRLQCWTARQTASLQLYLLHPKTSYSS